MRYTWRSIELFVLATLIGCGTTVHYYGVMDSAPFVEYSSTVTPDQNDGPNGWSLACSGKFLHVSTDNDSTVQCAGFMLPMIRKRFNDVVDVGYTFSFNTRITGDDDTYPYNLIDVAFSLGRKPVEIVIDPGLGLGLGDPGFTGDVRLNVLFGVPIKEDRFNLWVVPRFIGMFYTWRRVSHGLDHDDDIALSAVWGVATGVTYCVPLGGKKIRFVPGLTLGVGREPQLARITYYVVQPSFQIDLSF